MPKSKEFSVSPSEPTVHLESLDDGAIAVLTLDDSKGTNVMSPEMGDVYSRHIAFILKDPAVKAVILRGAGKNFSIGGHRDMLIDLGRAGRSEKELHDFMLAFYNRWLQILSIHVPVIAVLQGDCLGVAPIFACIADIAFADETLDLQVTFAGLGLYPGMALPTLLARKVGPNRASLLTMTNEIISGREAERIGLVERCVSAGAAYEQAVGTARAIAASAPSVVKLLKKNLGIKKTVINLEGHDLVSVPLGFTDTASTTCLHVPSIGLIVAGDAAYNGVHLHLSESPDQKKCQEWIAALDKMESLKPHAVIAGHKRVGNDDSPGILGETRKYIRDFERLVMQTTTARDLYDQMLKLYPEWRNRGALWTSVRAIKT